MLSFPGRFERTLNFVLSCDRLYHLPEVDSGAPDSAVVRSHLLVIQEEFITCPPAQRVAVVSQVALKKLSGEFIPNILLVLVHYTIVLNMFLLIFRPLKLSPHLCRPQGLHSLPQAHPPSLQRRPPEGHSEARPLEEELQADTQSERTSLPPVLKRFKYQWKQP